MNITYFSAMESLLTNEALWKPDKFYVFDYEAGTGKSRNMMKFLANIALEDKHKILYVQQFAKDDSLIQTVETMNKHAGREVAFAFYKENSNKRKAFQQAINSSVLCITHKMYSEACFGERGKLLENRSILVIDEFPNILESEKITLNDIANFWKELPVDNLSLINIANKMKAFYHRKILQIKSVDDILNDTIDLKKEVFTEEDIRILNDYKDNLQNCSTKELLERLIKFIMEKPLFIDGELLTIPSEHKPKKLKLNIILDANGGFDVRYRLSEEFIVQPQEKFHKYSSSNLIHFMVNTSKTALAQNTLDFNNIFKDINLKQMRKTLFITQKCDRDKLLQKLEIQLSSLGYKKDEIIYHLENTFQVDYFGNITGVNTYRDFQDVVLLKTPRFDQSTYLTHFRYFHNKQKSVDNLISLFNEMKFSIIAGEMYQAIKRVNRDNQQKSYFYVYTNNLEVIQILKDQLPGITYTNNEVKSERKLIATKVKKSEQYKTAIEKMIYDAQSNGKKTLQKKELRDSLGIDKGNFSKILKGMDSFFNENSIVVKNNQLLLSGEDNTRPIFGIA